MSASSLELPRFNVEIPSDDSKDTPAANRDLSESEEECYLVEWDGPDDPENPRNWSRNRRWVITVSTGLVTFCISFSSSVFSTATTETAKLFHVSPLTTTLGTSLFLLGFGLGPLVWGPASEYSGRRGPFFFGFTVFIIFQIPVAVASNLQTLMISRFFCGLFGSAPLAVIGGMLADLWDHIDLGSAVGIFAAATFLGPVAGPVLGGFISKSELGWRWTAYITAIMGALFGTIGLILVPETYTPAILRKKAHRLRLETKNWALHSRSEEEKTEIKALAHKYLLRPFIMLFLEPILMLISVYLGLIYGILYLFFVAYPVSFQQERGWDEGIGALPFIALFLGILVGCIIIVGVTKTRIVRKIKENGKLVPEERLPLMVIGAISLPIGLFWFGWTSSPHITWVPQVLAGFPIGMGIIMIFLQGITYIVDVYGQYSNSALAANTFIRGLAGAGFSMFARAMYQNLGVPWATSLLGFLCVALIPVPILFYIYGKQIRHLSRHAPLQ